MTLQSPSSRSFFPPPSFLIAQWGIRIPAKRRLCNTLHFSNRPKTPFHRRDIASRFSGARSRIGDPGSHFLIYTLKIRNRRKPKRISYLHFSNLYKSRPFFGWIRTFRFFFLRALCASAVGPADPPQTALSPAQYLCTKGAYPN